MTEDTGRPPKMYAQFNNWKLTEGGLCFQQNEKTLHYHGYVRAYVDQTLQIDGFHDKVL